MLQRLVLFASALSVFVIILIPSQGLTNSSGAPAKRTGAPSRVGAEDTCATSGCHESFAVNSGQGTLSITVPSQFEPGDTVAITIRVEQTGGREFGFQATVRGSSDPVRSTGTILLNGETKFSDALGEYITHNPAKKTADAAEWTFNWVAPTEGAENIIVYAAGVAGNDNNNPMGDQVYTTSTSLPVRVSVEGEVPGESFDVHAAYPNPFRSFTTVSYSLQRSEPVRFALYDALGRLVQSIDEGHKTAGTHEIHINGDALPTGTYYYQIHTPSSQKSHTLTRVK